MQQQEEREYNNELPPASYELLYLIQAYNQKEITFEEWLKLSREWAERMLQQGEQHQSY